MRQRTQQQGWEAVKKVQDAKDVKQNMQTASEERRVVRARQRAIGRELRRFYDGVADEPVPDEFMDLLKQMDDPDGEGSNGKGS